MRVCLRAETDLHAQRRHGMLDVSLPVQRKYERLHCLTINNTLANHRNDENEYPI